MEYWHKHIFVVHGISDVSDFVLPLYFTSDEQRSRNDFLGANWLRSFGIAPGIHIGFYNPDSGEHETCFSKSDKVAAERTKDKNAHKAGRGNVRKRGKATAQREDEHARVLKTSP